MYMILFVLHDISHCNDILDAWEEAGVKGVTILPSTGLARLRESALRENMPLFPSLEDLFQQEESYNRTFFTVIDDEELIEKVVAATESVLGSLTQPNTGFLTVLPVVRVYGINKTYLNED